MKNPGGINVLQHGGKVFGQKGLPGLLSLDPGIGGQAHQLPQVAAATRADLGVAKTRRAYRAFQVQRGDGEWRVHDVGRSM